MPRLAVPTLLGARRDFRLLFLASLGSSIGTWLAFVALVVDVYDRTGSAAWVSALLVAEFAPLVVIGLLAGPLLDRLPRRRVLDCDAMLYELVFLLFSLSLPVLCR